MYKILKIIYSERIYLGLLIIIVLFNVLISHKKIGQPPKIDKTKIESIESLSPSDLTKVLFEKRWLFSSFLFFILTGFFSFIFGIFLLARFIAFKLIKKRELIPLFNRLSVSLWGIKEVMRVVILIIFFTSTAAVLLAMISRLIGKDLFLLQLALLDIIALLVLIYFIKNIYKKELSKIGLNKENIFSSLYWAIASYLAFIPIFLLISLVNITIMNLINYQPSVPPVFGFMLQEKDPWVLVVFTIQVGLIAPFVEELFFRGFVYNAFKRYVKIPWAMVITAVFFAFLHQEIFHIVPIIFIGLLLCYVYEKTGSLYTAVFVHAIHNLSTTFLVLLIKNLLTI